MKAAGRARGEGGEEGDALAALMAVVRRLRGPGGCPWDREQTHLSLRPYVVEEAYEVVEAVEGGDPASLREELGDLLLQVLLHAVLAEEEGAFSLADVMDGLREKLVRRHPHVFGDGPGDGRDEDHQRRWKRLKELEKGPARAASVLDGVWGGLPALVEAEELQRRAAGVGFDWSEPAGALAKVREELAEVEAARRQGRPEAVEEEVGDLLFAAVNAARLLGVKAELALKAAGRKFAARFRAVEETLRERGLRPEELSLAELDSLWKEIKERQAGPPEAAPGSSPPAEAGPRAGNPKRE